MTKTTPLHPVAVEGASLALESVDDVEGSHGLAASMLSVGDGIADNVLKEDLHHAANFIVDETGDAFHATAASQTADSGLGDALDGIAHHLALGSTLPEALAALAASGHRGYCGKRKVMRINYKIDSKCVVVGFKSCLGSCPRSCLPLKAQN